MCCKTRRIPPPNPHPNFPLSYSLAPMLAPCWLFEIAIAPASSLLSLMLRIAFGPLASGKPSLSNGWRGPQSPLQCRIMFVSVAFVTRQPPYELNGPATCSCRVFWRVFFLAYN